MSKCLAQTPQTGSQDIVKTICTHDLAIRSAIHSGIPSTPAGTVPETARSQAEATASRHLRCRLHAEYNPDASLRWFGPNLEPLEPCPGEGPCCARVGATDPSAHCRSAPCRIQIHGASCAGRGPLPHHVRQTLAKRLQARRNQLLHYAIPLMFWNRPRKTGLQVP